MSILQMPLSIPITPQSLSSSNSLSCGPISSQSLSLTTKLSHLSLKTTPIRMGGGPRTYPGGVSKWQWKRMQAKKSKQLLKARLARERQIYEMRKRAELKAAVSELERPWETVEKPPNLFSVGADEQVKVLADRFQRAGGLDLWSEKDGPELFRPDNGLPSARFFPKGVVHSLKPYRKMEELDDFGCSGLGEDSKPRSNQFGPGNGSSGLGEISEPGKNSRSKQIGPGNGSSGLREISKPASNSRSKPYRKMEELNADFNGFGRWGLEEDSKPDRISRSNQIGPGAAKEGENRTFKGSVRKQGSTRANSSDSKGKNSGEDRRNRSSDGTYKEVWRSNRYKKAEVFDMSLGKDGSYIVELEKRELEIEQCGERSSL